MSTELDRSLVLLHQIRLLIDKLIDLREKEIEARQNRGFNPDDTTKES